LRLLLLPRAHGDLRALGAFRPLRTFRALGTLRPFGAALGACLAPLASRSAIMVAILGHRRHRRARRQKRHQYQITHHFYSRRTNVITGP
jgi:hypothetical protein